MKRTSEQHVSRQTSSRPPVLYPLKTLSKHVFWSAPLSADSDFTPEDPLALDYLGQQVGLWLLPRFTTRTSRAQNYAVVLYGLHLAGEALKAYRYPDTDVRRIQLFERWERFWALGTFELRQGALERSDIDAMRGVRGARAAWFAGDRPLPLEFRLISRQNELGGLGAYLSSLRHCGLVSANSLRPTPAAADIINNFWGEVGSEARSAAAYTDYALQALDLGAKSIARQHGKATLRQVGERSRLSALTVRRRTAQQERLWHALVAQATDLSTRLIAEALNEVSQGSAPEPEAFLRHLCSRPLAPTADVIEMFKLALVFGRVARALLDRFNRAYGHLQSQGWVAAIGETANKAFPLSEQSELRSLCRDLTAASRLQEFSKLQFHGGAFVQLVTTLQATDPVASLRCLTDFHRAVQRARGGKGPWIRQEGNKLILQVTNYSGYQGEAEFPSLKIATLHTLLRDLGKLA